MQLFQGLIGAGIKIEGSDDLLKSIESKGSLNIRVSSPTELTVPGNVGTKLERRFSRKSLRGDADDDVTSFDVDKVVVDKKKRTVRFREDPVQSDTDSDNENKFVFNRAVPKRRQPSPLFDSGKGSGKEADPPKIRKLVSDAEPEESDSGEFISFKIDAHLQFGANEKVPQGFF